MKLARQFWLIIALGAAIMVPGAPASAQQKLEGQVLLAGEPVVRATVTLWAAGADVPAQVAQTRTGADGRFALDAIRAAGNAPVYLVAKGGTANAGANNAVALMVLLGGPLPKTVIVNELTTVASAFVGAQFIKGEAISGNPLGLRIAYRGLSWAMTAWPQTGFERWPGPCCRQLRWS